MALQVRGVVFDARLGDGIRTAIDEAMRQANWPGAPDTFLTFNGATFLIKRGASAEELLATWKRLMGASK